MKDGKTKLQSIRFSANTFTVDSAESWLKDHGYVDSAEVTKTENTKMFVKNE